MGSHYSELELAAMNLSWMSGNLFLAWSAILFALHLRGTPRQQRIAAWLLVLAATFMLAGRLSVKGAMADHTLRSVVLVIVVGIAATSWSILARRGNRPARAIGYLGVLAFAPNAPYILTDLFHHLQDVRLAELSVVGGVVFAVQYGWFLVVGGASWVALLDLCGDWLRRHRPTLDPRLPYVAVCAVMAFGIYLGRIERFHSWHPLGEPLRFAHRVSVALTSPGPIGFTVVWWLVVMGAGLGGLRLLDRARAAEHTGLELVAAVSWALAGALMVSTPFVEPAFRIVGVDVVAAQPRAALVCVVLGAALSAWAGTRLARVLQPSNDAGPQRTRVVAWAAAAAFMLPVLGGALTVASAAEWYAQFRGLCEYSPYTVLHGDSCPDAR